MVLAIVSTGAVMANPVSAATIPVTAGSTSAQIQALIDDAHSGDTINFETGTYNDIKIKVNKTLNLVGNGAIINGVNESSTVIFMITAEGDADGSGSTIQGFEFNLLNNTLGKSTGYAIQLNKVSDVTVRNITSHNGKSAVYSGTAFNILIENCTFDDVYNTSYAVNIGGGDNITVRNNTISGTVDGVSMATGATNVYVDSNTFLNNVYGAFWGGGISNITFINNLFDGFTEALAIEKAANSTYVLNNTFINGSGDAIYIQNSNAHGTMTVISDIEIIGNLFKNIIGAAIGIDKSGIFNATGTGDSIVGINNTVDNVSKGYVVLYSQGQGLNFTMDSSYPEEPKNVSNLTLTSKYSSSSITHGKTTTYTVKVSNTGNGSADNIKINNILPSSNYISYKVNAVSRGSFNASTGTWNLDSLNANSDAIIVFTVTAKKAGSCSNTPAASYTDSEGSKTVNAPTSSLNINKDIRASYSYSISKTKVKKGSYFYITVTLKNSGMDTSGLYTVQTKLTNAFLKLGTSQTSPFKYSSSGKWTGNIGPNKTIVLKKKIKMNKKGKYTIPVIINGNTKKTYTITGY